MELCEEAKKTVEDNNMCAKVRTGKFRKLWPHSVTRLVRLRPLFCHPQRSIEMSLHGDDFLVPGEPVDLVWMKNELESKLEINTTIVGTDQGCRGR